jgi:sigma54-dependent transcription regulator
MAIDLDFGTVEEMAEAFGKTEEELLSFFKNIVKTAEEQFGDASSRINKLGFAKDSPIFAALQKSSLGQVQSFLSVFETAIAGSDVLKEGFNKIFSEATEQQQSKILDLVSSYDWTR